MKVQLQNMTSKYGRSILSILLYGIIFLVGTIFYFHPVLTSGFTHILGDSGDGRLVNYFLEHTWRWISDRSYSGSLYSPSFFFPYQNVLAFSENLFGSAPIYWISRCFLPSDLSFVFWFLIVCLLNFSAMVFVLRQEKVSPILAGLGGFLFAFPATRLIQSVHSQLFPQFCTPLALWLSWRFIKDPTKLKFISILFLIYWQILCGIYLGWFLLLALLCLGLSSISIAADLRENLWSFCQRCWKFITVACLIWGGALYTLLEPYLRMKSILGGNSYASIIEFLPKLASWILVPRNGHLLSSILGNMAEYVETGAIWEHYIFLGITTVVLISGSSYYFFAQKNWMSKDHELITLSFLCTGWGLLLLSLDFGQGISLWWIVYTIIPGASVIRAVSRIDLIILPCFLIAGLVWYDTWSRKKIPNRSWRISIMLMLLILGAWEQNIPSQTYDATILRSQTYELSQSMKKYCQVSYLFPEKSSSSLTLKDFMDNHLTAMWAGINANVPVINGYSGYNPPGSAALISHKVYENKDVLGWLRSQNTPDIDRLCFITWRDAQAPNFPNQIQPIESYKTSNYTIDIFDYRKN